MRSCSPLSKPTFHPRPLSCPHTPALSVVLVWRECRSDQMSVEGFAIIRYFFLSEKPCFLCATCLSSPRSHPPLLFQSSLWWLKDYKWTPRDTWLISVCVCFHSVFWGDLRQGSVNFTLRKSVFLSHKSNNICFPFSIMFFIHNGNVCLRTLSHSWDPL